MQFEQSTPPFSCQKSRQSLTFTVQRLIPVRLEMEVGSSVRSPLGMARAGQELAQAWHLSQ
jgi:hypothetical protein